MPRWKNSSSPWPSPSHPAIALAETTHGVRQDHCANFGSAAVPQTPRNHSLPPSGPYRSAPLFANQTPRTERQQSMRVLDPSARRCNNRGQKTPPLSTVKNRPLIVVAHRTPDDDEGCAFHKRPYLRHRGVTVLCASMEVERGSDRPRMSRRGGQSLRTLNLIELRSSRIGAVCGRAMSACVNVTVRGRGGRRDRIFAGESGSLVDIFIGDPSRTSL